MSKRNELYDPRSGDEAVRVESLRLDQRPFEPARTNYFTIFLIEAGSGTGWADAARFDFRPRSLLCFVPYQHIRLEPAVTVRGSAVRGAAVRFHANFLCVETFHSETGCSGVLFNDPYGVPSVALDKPAYAEIKSLIERISREQTEQATAYRDVMLAHLKVLLIVAARVKAPSAGACTPGSDPRHPTLSKLHDLIEANYRTLHAPADYAALLHLTPKTLGGIVREQMGLTLTELIRNRILIHAKWQLLHTLRPVKEIARELGFDDELYFSRLFKKATGYSPTFFREFETEIRGGSNLSMSFRHAPILRSGVVSDS